MEALNNICSTVYDIYKHTYIHVCVYKYASTPYREVVCTKAKYSMQMCESVKSEFIQIQYADKENVSHTKSAICKHTLRRIHSPTHLMKAYVCVCVILVSNAKSKKTSSHTFAKRVYVCVCDRLVELIPYAEKRRVFLRRKEQIAEGMQFKTLNFRIFWVFSSI